MMGVFSQILSPVPPFFNPAPSNKRKNRFQNRSGFWVIVKICQKLSQNTKLSAMWSEHNNNAIWIRMFGKYNQMLHFYEIVPYLSEFNWYFGLFLHLNVQRALLLFSFVGISWISFIPLRAFMPTGAFQVVLFLTGQFSHFKKKTHQVLIYRKGKQFYAICNLENFLSHSVNISTASTSCKLLKNDILHTHTYKCTCNIYKNMKKREQVDSNEKKSNHKTTAN